jgi:hypothetical protein
MHFLFWGRNEEEREVLVVICCIELWMWIYIKVCRWGLKI